MKKILVCGPVYGHHNIGDEAILESIILQFSDIANNQLSQLILNG